MRRHPTHFWWHGRPRLCPFALVILVLACVPLSNAQVSTSYVDWAIGDNSLDGSTNVVVPGTSHGPMRNIANAVVAVSNGDAIVIAPGYYAEFTWDPGTNNLTLNPQGLVNICADDLCAVDSVGDGIPDWWREYYFGSPNTTDSFSCASCDPTGDGLSNLQKYQDGIDPLVSYAINAPSMVKSWSAGNPASVTDLGSGASYTWSVDNGSVTTGQGTPTLNWAAGDTGIATLSVTMQTPGPGSPFLLTASVSVTPCSLSAIILAPVVVRAGSSNNTASLPDTFTTLVGFGGAGTVGLIQGSGNDTNFYALNDQGLVQVSPDGGQVYRMFQFPGGTNGYWPSQPIQGTNGNLYGVTYLGGNTHVSSYCLEDWYGYGSVYKISTNNHGSAFQTIYIFGGTSATNGEFGSAFGGTPDGTNPLGALVHGSGNDTSNFYGVTVAGGVTNCADPECCSSGFGTIFRVNATGTSFTNLYKFTGGTNGAFPQAGLFQGSDGFLYGTTSEGGTNNSGTIFKIGTNGNFTPLYQFLGNTNGGYLVASLTQGTNGVLYGTASEGGAYWQGMIFSLTTNSSSPMFTVLHNFTGSPEGSYPASALVKGFDGNFYGTTVYGGLGYGTIYRMTPTGGVTTVYQFTNGSDGRYPDGGQQSVGRGALPSTFDGYLYGTATWGGTNGGGTIYKFLPGTYTWSITNGTITTGQSTPNITWTAGTNGTVMICVTISDSQVCSTSICTTITSVNGTIIAAGELHSLALGPSSNLWAWGDNQYGELGDGTYINQSRPEPIGSPACPGISNVVAVAAANDFSVALDANGTVWTWGGNQSGQLGNGLSVTNDYPTPFPISGVSNVVAVAAGDYYTLALRADGTVWAWGTDGSGQLGDNGFAGLSAYYGTNAPIESLVPTQTVIVAIAAGEDHSIALQQGGTVWTWGSGGSGQLGNGSNTNLLAPESLTGISNVIAIAAGFDHTIALTSDGTVWTWGGNSFGELGRTNYVDSNDCGCAVSPGRVSGLSNAVAIAAGDEFTLAATGNGQVYAWGTNSLGQLGVGSSVAGTNLPMLVLGISNVVLVAANPPGDNSGAHSLAVSVAQGVTNYWSWGWNLSGEVGNGGTNNYQYTPETLLFCPFCGGCIQFDTNGTFTASCTGSLRLFFNDDIYGDNSGAFTVTVYTATYTVGTTNVPAADPNGVVIGTVSNGVTYSYTATGFVNFADPLLEGVCSVQAGCTVNASGITTNGVLVDCDGNHGSTHYDGEARSGFFNCPSAICYSLVGKIE